MAPKQKRTFNVLKDRAWREANRWVDTTGSNSPPPIRLDQLAVSKNIRNVKVVPLFSTAGLVWEKGHYDIFINSEARGISLQRGSVYAAEDGSWADFSPPLRFTIAHEVAHVFFYDAADGDHKAPVFKSKEALVEWECNRIARVLLLPKKRIRAEIADRQFDLEHVAELIEKFQVSPEVFMRRLHIHESPALVDSAEGFLAYVTEVDGQIRIKACQVWGPMAWSRFGRSGDGSQKQKRDPSNLEDVAIEQLHIHPDVPKWIQADEWMQEQIRVAYSKTKNLICNFSSRKIRHVPRGCLVALQVIG